MKQRDMTIMEAGTIDVEFSPPVDEIPFAVSEQSTPRPDVPAEALLTRVFKVTTARNNIIALSDFMNERKIDFEKIEL
jgi:hypothetical protein